MIASTISSNRSEESDNDSESSSDRKASYQAPTITVEEEEIIVFGGFSLATLQPVDLDFGILQERYEIVGTVHGMMNQINQIFKVHAQLGDIKNVQSMGIESNVRAQAGAQHLMRINHQRETSQRRIYVLSGILMVAVVAWILIRY